MGAAHDRPSLGLLQPIKGAIIAMQWFGGMHGFTRRAPGVTKAFASRRSAEWRAPGPAAWSMICCESMWRP